MNFTHASLFSGIGGFDLAADWLGWQNLFHCEIKEFGKRILKYYWPKAITYHDIKTTDFNIHRGTINVLSGGFPCQPFSVAGDRKGTDDDRHLWPEMLRAVREIQPGWIVGENVYGLVTWDEGLVFDTVQADLEAEGYKVWAYVLPACAVDAPHQRNRVWFVAYSSIFSANTSRARLEKLHATSIPDATGHPAGCNITDWANWPSQSSLCNGVNGFPSGLDNITIQNWRNESIMGGGNAIVPQVALQIFRSIEEYELKLL